MNIIRPIFKIGSIKVVCTRCKGENCTVTASYNYLDKKPMFCAAHRLIGMVDLKSYQCIFHGCDKTEIAKYNYPMEKKPIYCFKHKLIHMVDVKQKKCISDTCITRTSSKKYQGYCFDCFKLKNPDMIIKNNHKIKEKHVSQFIKTNFEMYNPIIDKIIRGGSSKKRPDILLNVQDKFYIIIEVDENGHNSYKKEDERLIEILNDLKLPIVVIRFNPDSYLDNTGKRVKSCFKIDKTKNGECIINNDIDWNDRLQVLKNTVHKYIDYIPEKKITIEKLFFSLI